MRRDKEMKQIALRVSIALSAGVFSMMPTVSAAPVLNNVVSGDAKVDQVTTPQVTNITSEKLNNVIDWQDFSVSQGETVRFDEGKKEHNYLNIVSGPNTSQIDGSIQGGKDVYIVNPNGVIFGNTASVDVGSLYVSTRPITEADYSNINDKVDMQPLKNTASSPPGDVVNMGKVQADTVLVEGKNVKFMDVDDIRKQTEYGSVVNNNVTIHAENIRLGHRPDTSGKIKFAAAANNSGSYTFNSNANTSNFTSIHNQAELATINSKLNGDYELAQSFSVSGSYTPIGGNGYGAFTGNFNGNYHTISGISVSNKTYGGLFGLVTGGTIKNVGVSSGTISANNAGGIAGEVSGNSTLKNVFNEGVTITASGTATTTGFGGGLVGRLIASTIDTGYNTAAVNANSLKAGGIVGQAINNSTIKNVYNTGSSTNGLVGAGTAGSIVSNAYTTLGSVGSTAYKGSSSNVKISANTKNKADYTELSGLGDGDGKDTVWRIYEGCTKPLLVDFLKAHGTVAVNYDYEQGSNAGNNNGQDLEVTYNHNNINISNIKYTGADSITESLINKVGTSINGNIKTSDLDASGNPIKKTIFYTEQQGYYLVGNHLTIKQREVDISSDLGDTKHITKVYDGTADASAAAGSLFESVDSTGIIPGDDTVTIDTSGITATFLDSQTGADDAADVGANKDVSISGTINLNNKGDYRNYKLSNTTVTLNEQTIHGNSITQKPITVSLKNSTGIDKEYDGKTTVTDASFIPSATQIIWESGVSTTGDNSTAQTLTLGYDKDANYVDDQDKATKMAGNYTNKVKYGGIKINSVSNGKTKNYKLVDASGKTIYSEAVDGLSGTGINQSTGGALYGSGKISPKNIASTGFYWYKDGEKQTATREYDGKTSYTAPQTYTVSNAGSDTGMIAGDSLTFTVQGADFVTSDTGTLNANKERTAATTKNVKDAKGVLYTVKIAGESASNYTLDGAAIDTTGTNTVIGPGSITARTLNVVANSNSYLEKVYDGTDVVKDSSGNTTFSFPGYLQYADPTDTSHHLLGDTDKSTISITGVYVKTGNDAAGKDVNYTQSTASDPVTGETQVNYSPADKNITYTAKVLENGQVSDNYVFSMNSKNTATFTGKGKIKPATITAVTFKDVSKTYDGTAVVTNTTNTNSPMKTNDRITIQSITGNVNNEAIHTIFDLDDSNQLAENSNVLTGTYASSDVVWDESTGKEAAQKVTYTGLGNLLKTRNYVLASDLKTEGKGTIEALEITNADWIKLDRNDKAITKVYNGDNNVEYGTVKATDYLTAKRAYIQADDSAKKLDIKLDVAGATYASQHSDNAKKQDVTYKLSVAATGNYKVADSLKTDGYVLKTIEEGGRITPKAITVTDALLKDNNSDAADGKITKVYDGNKKISAKGESLLTVNNQLLTDMDSTYNPTNGITAEFNDKNAGSKTVDYTLKLDGDSHSDYYFRNDTVDAPITKWTATGTIQKRTLDLSTTAVPSKTYDTKADVKKDTNFPSLTTIDFGKDTTDNTDNNAVVQADGFAISSLNGTYGYGSNDTDFEENADVYRVNGAASDKDVKYSGVLAALGDNAKNYEVADTFYGKGIIKPSTINENDFVFELYDNITQVYSGSKVVGEYGMKNEGDKHELDDFQRKWIDNTKSGINTPEGFVSNKDLASPAYKFTIKSAAYDTADVGPDKIVTYTIEVKASDLGNYEYTGANVFTLDDTITSGRITARPVTATVVHDTLTKYYDGDTALYNGGNKAFSTDTATGTVLSKGDIINLTGLIKDKDGNVIGENASTGQYVTAEAGEGNKSIEYTPAISGAGNNYKFVDSEGKDLVDGKIITTGNTINPFGVLVTVDSTPITKEYDGTASVAADTARAALQLGANYDNLTNAAFTGITDETGVYYDATNTKEDSNVNPDKNNNNKPGMHVVRYTGLDIGDSNYYLSDADGQKITAINGTGVITPYVLQGNYEFGIGNITKEYDKNTKLAYTGGDYKRDYSEAAIKNYLTAPKVLANGKEMQLVFSLDLDHTKYQGDGSIGTYTAEFRLGISNDNYNYSFDQVTINGQSVSAGPLNGVYYYDLTKDNATITPRRVYVSLNDEPLIQKVYDGTDKVINDLTSKVIVPDETADFLQGDDVSLDKDHITAVYADKNWGTDKDVTYSVALQGTDKGNYVLYRKDDGTELTAANPLMGKGDIRKAKLAFAPETLDKIYNGNANIAFTADDLHLTGITYKNGSGQDVTEKVVLSNEALAKVKGEYGTGSSASNFTADANVKRVGDTVVSKDILYSGLQDALAVMAADEIAQNYEIDSDKAFFASKGTINPIELNTLKAKWQTITDKTYDATPDVLKAAGSMQLFTTASLTDTPIEVSYEGKDSGVYVDAAGNAIKDVGNHGLKYTVTEVTKNLGNYQLSDVAAESAKRDWLSTTAGDNVDGLAVTGEITPLTLNVVAKNGFHKIYDGTTDIADHEVAARIDLDEAGKAILQKDSDNLSYDVAAEYSTGDANVVPGVIKNLKDIRYSLTLKGNTKGNYVLQGAVNDVVTGNDVYTNTAKLGDIEQRKVYVEPVDITGIDKQYDTTRALPDAYSSEGRFRLRTADADTGIVRGEKLDLDMDAIQGEYKDGHVHRDADGNLAPQDIIFDTFRLIGSDNAGNYVVATDSLTGSGTISPAPLTVAIKAAPHKVYDGEVSFVALDDVVGDTYTANKNLEVSGWLQDSDKTSANVLLSDIGYDDEAAGINKGYGYKISQSNLDYVLSQGENLPSIEVTNHGQDGIVTAKNGTIAQRMLTIENIAAMTKEYDGTEAGTANAEANISLGNYIHKDKDNLGLTATAVYHGADAGKSEDSDELVNHKVTYTLSLSNPNYQLADSVIDGTGTISRKGLNIVAMPVTVNNGETMPEFSGSVDGLVAKDRGLADLFTFAPMEKTTTNIPGSFEVYGWYNDRISGNLGLNYTFTQNAGNETAFTVNYVNTNNGNPDTKITPNSDVYNQISKDMSSGFGDTGAAAIEYRDKGGNVIAMETINSGEIHEGSTDGDLTGQSTNLANIGIVGGDIVNIEGADAASTADIQVSGDGTVINLEVLPLQAGNSASNDGTAEITNTGEITNSVENLNTDADSSNAEISLNGNNSSGDSVAQIQVVDDTQKLEDETGDKAEEKEKESEIAIESSQQQEDDEIELKVESEGVNVA